MSRFLCAFVCNFFLTRFQPLALCFVLFVSLLSLYWKRLNIGFVLNHLRGMEIMASSPEHLGVNSPRTKTFSPSCSRISKVRNLISIPYYYLIHSPYWNFDNCPNSTLYRFVCFFPRIKSKATCVICHRVTALDCLVFPRFQNTAFLCLSWTWCFLKTAGYLSCSVSLPSGFLGSFLLIIFRYAFLAGGLQKWPAFSQCLKEAEWRFPMQLSVNFDPWEGLLMLNSEPPKVVPAPPFTGCMQTRKNQSIYTGTPGG